MWKLLKKLILKRNQVNIDNNSTESQEIVYIKPMKPLKIDTFERFKQWSTAGLNNTYKGTNNAVNNTTFDYTKYKDKIKQINSNDLRLKILYYYLKDKTNNNLFKKESNSKIGEYFGCKRDMISNLFNTLQNKEYIRQANDIDIKDKCKYYIIIKEW